MEIMILGEWQRNCVRESSIMAGTVLQKMSKTDLKKKQHSMLFRNTAIASRRIKLKKPKVITSGDWVQ